MFEGAMGIPKRAIEGLRKGAKELKQDVNDIDFFGNKFDMINNSKKQKYDWSQDKIDLAKLDESNTEGMAKRMQGLEKSFK